MEAHPQFMRAHGRNRGGGVGNFDSGEVAARLGQGMGRAPSWCPCGAMGGRKSTSGASVWKNGRGGGREEEKSARLWRLAGAHAKRAAQGRVGQHEGIERARATAKG